MKRFDIAAIGDVNVDIILNGIESEPEIGKEKFASDMTVTLGGSTTIFAANAAAIGSKVCFVGMIGNRKRSQHRISQKKRVGSHRCDLSDELRRR